MRQATSIAVVTVTVVLLSFVAIWATRATFQLPSSLNSATSIARGTTGHAAHCHEHDGLPDPGCTPGAASPDVIQATIATTICRPGYTTRGVRSDGRPVRPPASFTEPLKVSGIAAYGYADRAPAHYEEDHLIPLEVGGDGWNPANLWPETRYGPHNAADKDKVENALHNLVCSGRVSLDTAQQAIARNWETALAAVR